MDQHELRADCGRCQGLCCVSLAFDRGEWFGFTKAASEPCRHLRTTNRCAIHASLARLGQAGCAAYDCYGAGQRVSELFAGKDWRRDPDAAERMFTVFLKLQPLNELRALLRTAERFELPEAREAERAALLLQLEAVSRVAVSEFAYIDVAYHQVRVHAFLRSLRDCVSRNERGFRTETSQPSPPSWRASCLNERGARHANGAAQLLSLRRK